MEEEMAVIRQNGISPLPPNKWRGRISIGQAARANSRKILYMGERWTGEIQRRGQKIAQTSGIDVVINTTECVEETDHD